MLMCPSSTPRMEGKSNMVPAPPLPDIPSGRTAGSSGSAAAIAAVSLNNSRSNNGRAVASAPHIFPANNTTFRKNAPSSNESSAASSPGQIGAVKHHHQQQQELNQQKYSSSLPASASATSLSATATIRPMVANGSTTVRAKATHPTTLLSRNNSGFCAGALAASHSPHRQSDTQPQSTASPFPSNNTAGANIPSTSTAAAAFNNSANRSQPKFKLLQRPKIPRGHKPPPTKESRAAGAPNNNGTLSISGTADNHSQSPPSRNNSARGPPSAPLGPGEGSTETVDGSTYAGGEFATGSSGSISTLPNGIIAADSDHKNEVCLDEELARSQTLAMAGISESESSRRMKQIESIRSLRERERLYEEAKRRIWTSANRRAMGLLDLQQQSASSSLGGPSSYHQQRPDSNGSHFNRLSGAGSVTADRCNGGTARPNASDSTSMAPIPQQPLYEYEPPFQPGSYYMTEDGLHASQPQPPLTQTFDQYDTRRPFPRASAEAGSHGFQSSAGVGAGGFFGSHKSDLPIVIEGGGGRHGPMFQNRPVSVPGGEQQHQHLAHSRDNHACNSEAPTPPPNNELRVDDEDDTRRCCGGPNGHCCSKEQPQYVIQSPIIQPWELMPADPQPENGYDSYNAFATTTTTGRQNSSSNSILNNNNNNNTHSYHLTSNSGPPPLEDDFSFPPLGRTAAGDNHQFHNHHRPPPAG